ncbi:MAG: DUF853 family protein [Proteobacteria bacterium]|nr:DUF853 family protein [Pseudomonadota bacterium]
MHLGRTAEGDLTIRPKDLRTHAVIVGMTGSGKTGLGLVLLEELVAAGVPVIAIDPKGDLGNLGLLFPDLAAEDFAPWADGQDPAVLAARWSKGLGPDGSARVRALKGRLDLRLYTPGSEAAEPVDLLGALARPSAAQLADGEALRGLVSDTVSGLLSLVGKSSDPVRDPAHIVLSTLIEGTWSRGEDLDLEGLITGLVDPPFEKVGVFPTDRFFPPDDRMKLAMAFNGVIAAPSFAAWTRGAVLDIDEMLTPAPGSTPVHVFSTAHLSEGERHFFTSLLLGRVLAWSRTQPGTERLRAVVFLDEAAGYLPPHPANPPTKGPILTLMKQARAVGLGVVLSTQNPVDLDYKALSNSGLWAIGRLRTEQDRKRLVKGLPDPTVEDTIQALDKRQFLLARAKGGHDVFHTRFAHCYLRGPLTRHELSALHIPIEREPPAVKPETPAAQALPDDAPPIECEQRTLDPRVVFSARLAEAFGPYAEPAREDGRLVLRSAIHAELALTFEQARHGFRLEQHEHRVVFPLGDELTTEAIRPRLEPTDFMAEPPDNALFAQVPGWLDEAREWKSAKAALVDAVYRSETAGMFVHKTLRLYGRTEESREEFTRRCRAALDDRIDVKVEKLKDRAESKAATLDKRVRDRERRLEEQRGALSSRQTEEWVNVGETVLSMFTGRRKAMSTVATKRSRTTAAKQRIEKTAREITDLQVQIDDLMRELSEEIEDITRDEIALLDDIEERPVRLRKKDIQVLRMELLWIPTTRRIG